MVKARAIAAETLPEIIQKTEPNQNSSRNLNRPIYFVFVMEFVSVFLFLVDSRT